MEVNFRANTTLIFPQGSSASVCRWRLSACEFKNGEYKVFVHAKLLFPWEFRVNKGIFFFFSMEDNLMYLFVRKEVQLPLERL